MSFNFIDDSRWKDLDEGTKQKMLDVSFKEDVASDNRWQTLDENTQRAMRDTYFNEARLHEEYVTAPEERGWARAALSHAARGTVSAIGSTGEVLELVDLTPREIDTNAGFLDEFGRGIVDWSEKSIKEKPYLRPSKAKLRGDVGFVKRGVMGGVESMPLSASVVVGALGGALATSWIPIPGARIVGGAVGGLTALIAQFGVGQYGKEYKSAYEELGRTRPNISEEEKKEISHRSAFGSASFEVGTELPEHLFALYTFGGSKVLTAPIKATLKNMLRKPVKTLLKGVGKQAPMSVSSEMVAGGGQAWTRQREGLLGPTIGEGVKESIIPAITMSLFFGAGAAGFNRVQSRSFMKQLNSPNTNTRLNAADLMAKRIAGNTKDESLANVWRQSAQDTISKGEAFNLNESIVDFASIKMAEDIEQDQEIVRREAVGDIFKATTTDEAVEAFDMAVTTDISELERMVAGEPTEIAPTKTEAIREVALEKEKPLEITKTEPQISEHLKDIRDNLDNAFIELDEGNQEPLDQIIQDASGDIELEAVRRGLDNRGINPDRYLPKTPYSPAKNKTLSVEEMEGAVGVEPAKPQPITSAEPTKPEEAKKYKSAEEFIGEFIKRQESSYPRISGNKVDGRVVRDEIPNTDSISATLTDYTELSDIREVPMSDFGLTGKHYSKQGNERIAELASQIKDSGEITPLIIVIDKEGPYILEGSTRAEALYRNGAKSFPAGVVVDNESLTDIWNKAQPIQPVPEAGKPAKLQPVTPAKPKPSEAPTEAIEGEGIGEVAPKTIGKPIKYKQPRPSKVRTLIGAIKELGGVNFLNFTGELKNMDLSVKYLHKKSARGIDLVEQQLKEDGWLYPNEELLDVLADKKNLSRDRVGKEILEKPEHKLSAEEQRIKKEMKWEPEAPPEGDYVTLNAEDLPKGKKLTLIEGKSREGWDVYEVTEKDPFEITLVDGQTITLSPLDKVQVLKKDIAKPKVPKEQVEGFKPEEKIFGGQPIPKVKVAKKEELAALGKIERKATSKFQQDSLFEPNQQGLFGVKPTEKLSKVIVSELLSLPHGEQVYPYGNSNIDLRKRVMKELTGKDLPFSKIGAGAVRDELLKAAGLTKEGKAVIEYENELIAWLKDITEKPAGEINKDTIILKAKDTPRKTSDIPGVYLSADKKYAGAYANGEVDAAHQRGTLTPKNGAIIEVKIDAEESIGFGDIMQSLEKDDLYNLLIESGATEETAKKLSTKPKEATDYIDVVSGTNWMQKEMGYDEVFRDNIKWGDIVKIEIFKNSKLNRTIKGDAKVMPDEITFYTGTPYTEHLEILVTKPAEKEFAAKTIKPDEERIYYAGTEKGKLVGKYTYLTTNPEYAKNFGTDIRQFTALPEKTLDLTSQAEKAISFEGFQKILKKDNITITEEMREKYDDVEKPIWMWIRKYPDIAEVIKSAGYDSIKQVETFTGKGKGETTLMILDKSKVTEIPITYRAPTEIGAPKYATKQSISDSDITISQVRDIFKPQHAGLTQDGNIWVKLRAGYGFQVKNVQSITENELAFEIGRGRMKLNGEFIAGKFEDDTIEITKGIGDIWTLTHESEHLAEKAGLITPLEIGVLKSKIRQLTKQGKFETQNKDDIGGQEDRAKFIEAELHNRASYTGITQRILQKIADFIDSMVNLFHTTSRGVVRGFESGEIFQREVAGREVQTISPAYALAGKKAIGAPTGQLAKAQEMLAEGKSEKEVWKETGWLKGAEGKDKPLKDVWKWEIDDSGAKFNSQKLKNIDKGKGLLTTDTLSQLLSHEELYKNYPQLRNVLTTIEVDFDAKRNTGSFTPAIDRSTEGLVDLEAEIKIKAKSIQDVKETLLHEIQHVIQREESFVKGGSPALQAQSVYFDVLIKLQSEIDELKSKEWKETNPDKRYNIRFELKEKQELYQELRAHPDIAGERIGLGKKAYQQYRKLAGEIESRDTAARAKLTAEERRMKMPYESQGIPREEWIITEGEGTSFSVEPARSIKKPLSIDAINEMYADAIEVADRAKNRELARKLQRELEFIGGTITLPSEIRKLRGNIRAWANYKGLTKKKLREIVKKVTGHLSTTHKKTTVAQLKEVLKQVARTRPRIVDKKTVVTKKTEGRIQTLKTNLTNDKQMTEAVFQGLLQTMRIKEPRYISKHRFITETQGKEVINRMLKIAPVVKVELGIKEERKTVPGAKAVADKIESKYKREDKAMKNIRTYSLLDMHHFADAMEKLTGVPFGKFREVISRKRHEIEYEIDKEIGKVSEGESFKEIAQDEAAVQRINDYVASKLPQYYKGVPEYPKDITENEKKIANEIIAGLKRKEGAVRYNRFFLWREKGIVIPNAPDVELMKATEILETQGDAEIRKWLEGRSWGVVKSGYGAEEVLGAKVMVAKHKPGFGLRGLMSRVTTKYQKQERDILKRYASYIRSITYRTELRPLIDGWVELFENNKEKFAEPRKVANLLTRNIKETLGEKNDMTALEEYMIRLYSQAARTIFLDIRKGVRNLFQNIAFTTDPTDLLKGKKLSKEDRKYFDIYLDQSRGIQRDWLYQEYEGIPGFSTLNKIADYINVMGRTDRANRLWAYTTRLVKVRRSIENHPNYKTDEKEMIAMMAESKWGDVEQAERVHAIDKLATEGEDAMVREIAGSFVKKVHFLYGRSERSPAEQGSELTRILSNLFTFRKGYVQRIVLDVRKLRSGQKEVESLVSGRKQALKSLSGVMIMGAFASWIYTTLTGDEREPYRPDKIIGDLSLGGLATGMQEQVGDLTRDMMSAATGDSAALGRVINGIARANDSFIPFYNEVLHAIEGLTGYRNVDKAVLRQIRSALDDRYKAKSMGFYKQGRTALERAQHIVFGTESESMREKFRKEYKERKDNRESLIPLRKKFNEYNRGKEEKISWTSITK